MPSRNTGRPGDLTGRTAVITGASSGIGAAIARSFLNVGARVHGIARRHHALHAAVGSQHICSGRFVPHALDVGDADAVQRLADELADTDPIGTLVCAAGTNLTDRRLRQLTPAAWDDVVRTNLHGVFYPLRAFLGQLRHHHGDVVIISSVSGAWPDRSGPVYQASKAALLGLSRAAGWDEHADGVRISTILPGIVDTPLLDRRPEPPPEDVRKQAMQPEDIATVCLCAITLPPRAHLAEMTLVATRLQSVGNT